MPQSEIIDVESTTIFRDDADTSFSSPPTHTSPTFDMLMCSGANSSIKDVLSRPVRLWAGKINSSAAFAQTYSLPDFWIKNSRNVRDKLSSYNFLKGTLVVKFEINATPFQQGKYWMFYAPYVANSGRTLVPTLSHSTAYPGVEIDAASSKSGMLRIPFISPYSHLDLINGAGTFGNLYIEEISRLKAGESSTVANGSLHCWMEDAEVFMPAATDNIYAQMKTESNSAAATGNISSFASKIGGLASSVGSAFPVLSGITGRVAWVSKLASGVASAFGYSKPASVSTNDPFYLLPARGYTHSEDVDNSVTLGNIQDNSIVGQANDFGTNIDEMQISYAAGRPCVFKQFDWKTDQVENTTVSEWPVHPLHHSVASDGDVMSPTLLQFIASIFAYWRGGITYRLAFTKTAFHSGRILIVYVPYGAKPNATTEEDLYNQCHKIVLDLTESSEITFTVPYVSNQPWKRSHPFSLTRPFFNGSIRVVVLNPLVASSDSVSKTVQATVWESAAPDFRVAGPQRTYATSFVLPTAPTPVAQILNETSSEDLTSAPRAPISLIPSVSSFTDSRAEECTMGEAIVSLRSLIKRFTPLLSTYVPYDSTTNCYAFPGTKKIEELTLDPAYFLCESESLKTDFAVTIDATGNPVTLKNLEFGQLYPSLDSYVSQIYRFYRGSRRYKYLVDVPSTNGYTAAGLFQPPSMTATLDGIPSNTGILSPEFFKDDAGTTVSSLRAAKFSTFQHSSQNGALEITVPYYSPYPISVLSTKTANIDRGYLASRFRPRIAQALRDPCNYTLAADKKSMPRFLQRTHFPPGTLLVACGDDASFGFLAGAPYVNLTVYQ